MVVLNVVTEGYSSGRRHSGITQTTLFNLPTTDGATEAPCNVIKRAVLFVTLRRWIWEVILSNLGKHYVCHVTLESSSRKPEQPQRCSDRFTEGADEEESSCYFF